jgi:hypothetical protein
MLASLSRSLRVHSLFSTVLTLYHEVTCCAISYINHFVLRSKCFCCHFVSKHYDLCWLCSSESCRHVVLGTSSLTDRTSSDPPLPGMDISALKMETLCSSETSASTWSLHGVGTHKNIIVIILAAVRTSNFTRNLRYFSKKHHIRKTSDL